MTYAPRLVLICMFEPEKGPPGEFARFRDREGLQPLDLPGTGLNKVWMSPDGHMLAILAGVGTANTAVSIMALGYCPELDLSGAFWMVSGIAGGNPQLCSLGSPIWADWVVDGDLAFEIDSRDIPSEWPNGILPLGAHEPFGPSSSPELFGLPYQVFQLHAEFIKKAYELTAHLELTDSEALSELRAPFTYMQESAKAPRVQVGGSLSGARFWHGPRHNAWAEKWVDHWTDGKSRFFTSAMEDTGTLHALHQLGRMGLTDDKRVLILRTVSNFTTAPDGRGAVDSLAADSQGGEFPGQPVALENAYRVASTVYKDIIANPQAWS